MWIRSFDLKSVYRKIPRGIRARVVKISEPMGEFNEADGEREKSPQRG